MELVTVIVPFYRNVEMLKTQIREWSTYEPEALSKIKFIIVDDGSPEKAEDIIPPCPFFNYELYRILIDKPWNRNGARNLGAHVATSKWIIQHDIDHLLPAKSADALISMQKSWFGFPENWFRFERYRVGTADETRMKDALPRDAVFGKIKPHIDSYLVTRERYWKVGGYDEDYSGFLGGGSPFLKQLSASGEMLMLPPEVSLHVYTRSTCKDASDFALSRDTLPYERMKRAKEKSGNTRSRNPLRFPWERVL